ncbi:MAG: hypothetical protein JW832_00670, partial [Deltaproteobacteria bacterium]|nr:hypothetical protein [Deltaproteobacteria bacterium]
MKLQISCIVLAIFFSFQHAGAQSVSLPQDTPFWENNHITIDVALINTMAADYMAEAGSGANPLKFFLGYLPLKTVDQFCTTSPDKEQMRRHLGAMYISGFYGGLWLRDMLFSNPADPSANGLIAMLMKMMPQAMKDIMALGADELVFKGVANLGGGAVDLGLKGSLLDIIHHNYMSVDMFLMIYGYDYGYYYYLINNPPPGVTPVNTLQCDRFMDCTMTGFELTTLNQYKPVGDRLLNPQCWKFWDPAAVKYCDMYHKIKITGEGSVSMGNLVWQQIMGSSQLFDAAYNPLVDLSARFMLVSELALLPTMKGYAELNKTAGKCGLLQEAGLMVWVGSYFMGLSS